jgi:hypothetical protein
MVRRDTAYRDFCLPYALRYRPFDEDYRRQSFSVNGREGASISIEGRGNITVTSGSSAEKKGTAKVESFLGESRNDVSDGPAAGESDIFYFVANAGDHLTVRLEADGVKGNNGGQATLRFIGPPTKQVSGELPLRIDVAQLSSTGRYDIEIEQAAGQGEEGYRGGYILTVESSLGNIERLVPTDSVEF